MQLRTAKEIIEWAESQKKQFTVFGALSIQYLIVHAIKEPLCRILNRLNKPLGIIEAIRILIELNRIKNFIVKELPEPTRRTMWHPNSHILDDVGDEFFEKLNLPSRENELKAIYKLVKIIHDYDKPYRFLINRFLELWLARSSEWQWHDDNEPTKYWKGDINGNQTIKS